MIAVMTMAPIQLQHRGQGLTVTGLVISAHIAGMFAPSPVSGRINDRFGSRPSATAAGLVLAAASAVAAATAADTSDADLS
jgi:MFS family permease